VDILLATLNAKYFHTSLGLRYLYANLAELQPRAAIREFIISQRPIDIAEALLAESPRIIGFGVYIWNVVETAQVIAILKAVAPQTLIVLGGPEVSHEFAEQPIVAQADYLLTGQADLAFRDLCRQLLAATPPPVKILHAPEVALADLALPYAFYTAEDIANRLIYVEASRGCPFKCQFCLSSLDKTALPFELERFLAAMAGLHDRGVRHFKFVDRTFNLSAKTAVRILEFFLARLDDKLFLHFELIPDRLPDAIRALIPQFPAGTLQFEIGVQTLNPQVQARIERRQDDALTLANLRWIREETRAHIHADLIVGLPGEDLASFAAGFDALVALDPQEIQIGILKRLRGTPLIGHTEPFALRFNPVPPYNVLCTSALSFHDLQRMSRFARYWDLIANSGRFGHTRPLLLGDQPFARFMAFADWLFATTHQTHHIAFERLFERLFQGLTQALAVDPELARAALAQDYAQSGLRGTPAFLQPHAEVVQAKTVPNRQARQTQHVRNT
jgi:radical SAM superfamily enzyme YgiQ (UPF0313 family)